MERSAQPLQLTPPFWIALALVALVGVAARLDGRGELRTLPYLDRGRPVVIPARGQSHDFPRLGIRITPPDGWSYWSTTDDEVADRPVFANPSIHSIVSIRPFHLVEWPPRQRTTVDRQHEHVTIEWVAVDHRRAGRLDRAGDTSLLILVVTHTPKSRLVPAVEAFCDRIEVIADDNRR